MHLRSRYLPRPSASSPPDNRAPPMSNAIQVPDLEGLYREIHVAPPIPDIERSHHSNHSGGRSQNLSTDRARRWKCRSPSPPRREGSSSESNEVPAEGGEETGRGRSPRRGDRIGARNKSTSQKIQDLDARLDAINTGTNAPVIVDTLMRQTEPPFIEREVSKIVVPKTAAWDHRLFWRPQSTLCRQFHELQESAEKHFPPLHCSPEGNRELERLRETIQPDCIKSRGSQRQSSDHGNDGRTPTLSALQSKVNKYIAAEELAEAKRRRRENEDHKRKEPDTRQIDYREETRNKKPGRDSKYPNDRRPHTPPRRPEFILPPLNTPVTQVLSEIKHEEFVKWPGKIKTDP
ncbi:hypothetical protein Acr_16g0001170 [Actinidia rufa]|uniref:Uncharacterized protein n=1 Tax=Actinidia rufa TaxID=165716 RepID=A0A7J0FXT8_9ERIC|nr:hypothetical protein Acr_16g0001170 [Actinidia rufa]